MDALCEDIFENESDQEEWSDGEWNERVPRGSWKRCNDCRNKINICGQCKFWLENYGCPRPDNTIKDSSSIQATETKVDGLPHASKQSRRPYIPSKDQERSQTPTRRNSILSDHGFGSWNLESQEALTTSWTSVSKSSHSFTTEQDHLVQFDILEGSDIDIVSISPRLSLYTQQVPGHYQQTETHQISSSTGAYLEQHQDWHYDHHLPDATIRHVSSRTEHRYFYTNTTATTLRSRGYRQAPKPEPKPPSPFDSGYIHVLFSNSHSFSTCHVRGLWTPRPFGPERLDASWRWRNYKRVILRYYGLLGLAEVQARGWNGNVKGAVIGLSIVFVEWPSTVWAWVRSWAREEIGGLLGWSKIGEEERETELE
ncbi:hypothetical protein QBC41DRAFT_100449 [Cercophora samala]|uniref:Uncharacterized protein n=1 Tax=Cercophora samala TaxID=330535 RepID=A0AA39ZFT2_9PEZI|nr:hypothetical protein QBC41DRAFT_100449 [Cercophora samala]